MNTQTAPAIVGVKGRPGRWEVIKRNPKSVVVRPLEQQLRTNLKTYPHMLTDAPDPAPGGVAQITELPAYLDDGQIVTVAHPELAGQLLVVTSDTGRDKIGCAPLFGGRGWRVPRPLVEPVTPAELVRTLLLRVYPIAVGGDEQSAISLVRELLGKPEFESALREANGA